MTNLTTDIRNAYENRDREGLERLLARVARLEQLVAGGQMLFAPVDRCTCQKGPSFRVLCGVPGEPTVCADCRKPLVFDAVTSAPPVVARGIPLDMQGVVVAPGQWGPAWNGPVDAQGRPVAIGEGSAGGTGGATISWINQR